MPSSQRITQRHVEVAKGIYEDWSMTKPEGLNAETRTEQGFDLQTKKSVAIGAYCMVPIPGRLEVDWTERKITGDFDWELLEICASLPDPTVYGVPEEGTSYTFDPSAVRGEFDNVLTDLLALRPVGDLESVIATPLLRHTGVTRDQDPSESGVTYRVYVPDVADRVIQADFGGLRFLPERSWGFI